MIKSEDDVKAVLFNSMSSKTMVIFLTANSRFADYLELNDLLQFSSSCRFTEEIFIQQSAIECLLNQSKLKAFLPKYNIIYSNINSQESPLRILRKKS